jgi:hypothetical protein
VARRTLASVFLLVIGVATALAASPFKSLGAPHASEVSLLNGIADQGFNHSELAQNAEYLSDQIGGRMTNSPAMRKAERWAQEKFKAYGLKEVHAEGFEFGRGWWIESSHVRLLNPRPLELKGIPIAWTPPTNGNLTAEIVVAPMAKEKDFADWHGKLIGKIVLVSFPAAPKDTDVAPFARMTENDIVKMERFVEPAFDPEARARNIEHFRFRAKLDAFLAQEGALAQVLMSRTEGRLVHGEGYLYKSGQTAKLPAVELAAEDYRKLARLAKLGPVKLEIADNVHFDDSDVNAYNTFGEIPGEDGKGDFVMAGAHLDSWVAADGAADNGAGSIVVLEAARILSSLKLQPRRTIRFVLWSGEEQGLLGSAAYVEKHLAHRPPFSDPALADLPPSFYTDNYPVQVLPGMADLDAYFNIDNGSGKIRGIYTEGNLAVVQTFREWLSPFAAMGANSIVAEPTGGTDHVYLSRLGLPAFQFIQDPLDYESRVHHTDLDTYDHLRFNDLKQAAVIMATVLFEAAQAEKPLSRKPVPSQPTPADPFEYVDPSAR